MTPFKPCYCINPACPHPTDPAIASAEICPHCQSPVVLKNRYRPIKLLGEGGFGKTYLVEDTVTGEFQVLKVLLKNIPIAVKLFQREAKVLSQLDHPGIPKVWGETFTFRPGFSIHPLHCLVMEFIEGSDLQSWLSNGEDPIDLETTIALFKQLLEILNVLHHHPIQPCFHRDIKPANIMRRPNGQLVLIDFGAVREVTSTLLVKVGAGQALTGICSPGYAPPEQIEGKPLPQSDFFALGRTFVHLLTGKHPLELENDPDTGMLCWRDAAPAVPELFADLIDELMAPAVGRRPPTTEAIAKRLEAIENPSVKPTREVILETTAPPTVIRAKQRRRAIWALPVAVMVVGWQGWMGWRWGSDRLAKLFHDRGVTQQITDQLYLAQVNFDRALAFKPNYPEAAYHLGRNYELMGDFKQARTAYERARRGKLPEAYNNLARLDIMEGKPDRAIPWLKEGLTLTQDETIRYALFKNLGWASLNQKQYTSARTDLETAIALKPNRSSAYCLLAQLEEAQGRWNEAIDHWTLCRKFASRAHVDEKRWLQLAEERLHTHPRQAKESE